MGWDIARGKIFVKLQSACVQHIQLKAKSLCENMQLDMQSKRIFNVFPLVQIQHAVHSGMLMLSFTGDRHILALYIFSHHSHTTDTFAHHYRPHAGHSCDEAELSANNAEWWANHRQGYLWTNKWIKSRRLKFLVKVEADSFLLMMKNFRDPVIFLRGTHWKCLMIPKPSLKGYRSSRTSKSVWQTDSFWVAC